MEEFKYLLVLFIFRGEWSGIGATSTVMWMLCQSVVMKRAQLKRKGVDLLVDLPSNLHLWSQALGSNWKNKTADTRVEN